MSTGSEIVARQYEAWVYPKPVEDLAEALATGKYWDISDPAHFRRKLWPRKIEPDDLSILVVTGGYLNANGGNANGGRADGGAGAVFLGNTFGNSAGFGGTFTGGNGGNGGNGGTTHA